jgi:hypothetical protein
MGNTGLDWLSTRGQGRQRETLTTDPGSKGILWAPELGQSQKSQGMGECD